MLEIILLVVLGMFLGWNLPMPDVAKNFQNKVITFFKSAEIKKWGIYYVYSINVRIRFIYWLEPTDARNGQEFSGKGSELV